MTTSQASRIFGIPYNSLLMYVRGKYGKSLKLEQLRKDCISGPPIELLQMGASNNNNNNSIKGSSSSGNTNGTHGNSHQDHQTQKDAMNDMSASAAAAEAHAGDLLSNSNALFNPFPGNFYPEFAAGFPGIPLSMLNLLPAEGRQLNNNNMSMDDDDDEEQQSKQSVDDDDTYKGMSSSRNEGIHHRQELLMQHQD